MTLIDRVELEARDAELRVEAERDWLSWLALILPSHVKHPFAPFHEEFWEWVWRIMLGVAQEAFVGIWSRGAAKSTSAEAAVTALACRGRRRYCLYVNNTQDQSDKHVASIGAMMESERVGRFYPQVGARAVGKFGASRGWRRNRLRTASGFTVDAIGLDTAARGVKVEDQRPDLIVIDDLDEATDTPGATAKKLTLLTTSILPAGSDDVAVVAIQNLIHRDGIFARLAGVADERADFLTDRILSGPVPAVDGLVTEERELPDGSVRDVIVAGVPTWAGMDLDVCQKIIDTEGITAFRTERQHEAEPPSGGLWASDFKFGRCSADQVPPLLRVVVWVDPAVTDTDRSDSHACQADGLSADGVIYRLRSWEGRTSPVDSLKRALRWAVDLGAQYVGVETDQGGDTWQSVYREALADLKAEMVATRQELPQRWPHFDEEKAGAGYGPKVHRANQMLADYERPGRIVHVLGTHDVLERALRRFGPKGTKPFDLVDVAYWGWLDLSGKRRHRARPMPQAASVQVPVSVFR